MPVQIFLSAVSDEFGVYRDELRSDLTRHNVDVKIQEDFKDYGGITLEKLDLYIQSCDAVVHLVGDMTGALAKAPSSSSILTVHRDLYERLPSLRAPLMVGDMSYTQWEAWLAIYHRKLLFIAEASEQAPRGPKYIPTSDSRASQTWHIERLRAVERYPGCTFKNLDDLAKHIALGAILDLLAIEKANAHLAGLLDSLVDIAAMVFVDLTRLTSVSASDRARAANSPRYAEFVDVADLHLAELNRHISRLTTSMGATAVQQCLGIERRAAYLLVRLRRSPHLDRSWPDFARMLADLAREIHSFALAVRKEYYTERVAEVVAVVGPAVAGATELGASMAPDDFARTRLSLQSMVLRRNESNGLPILAIRDDIDRRLALPYFAIDATLLRVITV